MFIYIEVKYDIIENRRISIEIWIKKLVYFVNPLLTKDNVKIEIDLNFVDCKKLYIEIKL